MLRPQTGPDLTTRYKKAAHSADERLSYDEEAALVARANADDAQALEWLMRSYLPLIVNLARKYCRHPDRLDDFIQQGAVGFINCCELTILRKALYRFTRSLESGRNSIFLSKGTALW